MHVQDLERGYLDRILAEAVALGIDPIDAIRMVTLNPAEHYGLGHGVVMPGMLADLTIVRDLKEFEVKQVFIGGKLVARDGKRLFRTVPRKAPPTSFKVRKKDARDFMLKAKERSIRVRVIDATDTPYTGELAAELQVVDGRVVPDVKGDVLQLAVVERYGHERAALGFVKGFGLREGAIASSIAHDSHNIVVVGATPSAMVKAVNEVIGMRGGLAVVSRQGVVGLELPIAGLMSNKRPGIVARKLRRVMEHVKKLGCKLDAPFMTLSFLTLPVIPKLKLTDKGLFDVTSYKFVSVKLGG
jgi:adenine deaminase